MLRLNSILLTQFKSYQTGSFNFTGNIVGICGLNGAGKTNLLDAIYYCAFTKSYFAATDAQIPYTNEEGFRIEAAFTKADKPQKIVSILRGQGKKEFFVNDVQYPRLAAHIGQLPVVIIAPDDVSVITGASDGRRKYLDTLLCQLDANYLHQLMQYNKLLLQRNSVLKKAAETNVLDDVLLEVLNVQMTPAATYVFEKRKTLVNDLLPMVADIYHALAQQKEVINLRYESILLTMTFADVLTQMLPKDRALQRTSNGIHKDDVFFEIAGAPFKTIASQGQRKSLLFALKLAEYEMLKQHNGFSPILLLDDVFEKLDATRMRQLLSRVCLDSEAQVFITDTHAERLEHAFKELSVEYQLLML